MDKKLKIQQYFANKKILDEIRDDITLKRWKILSTAYKQGKSIWGAHFTKVRLSNDMGVPVTTVLRCLSLDRCNPKTWRLIKAKKISCFKVAQICQSKNITYQDEVVEAVIKDDLSTYQISTLKVNNLKDVNKERLRLACKDGYSRKSSAYRNFNIWIERGRIYLLMKKDNLPKDKLPEIKQHLKNLDEMIKRYIK